MIRVITQPSVYLIARPEIADGLPTFLEDHGLGHWSSDAESDAEAICEVGGRLCYMSFAKPRPGGNRSYLKHILESGHGSVIEHSNFTFIFAGVSRSLTHELVRHRAGMSYSQLSQRYVDESDVAFVIPPAIAATEDESDCIVTPILRWTTACEMALMDYSSLVNDLSDPTIADKTARRKQAREEARSVLPNCTETKIMVTGNCRAWRHFLEIRGSVHADAEIRRLALAVLPVLVAEAPAIFGDYEVLTTPSGITHISTPFRKV